MKKEPDNLRIVKKKIDPIEVLMRSANTLRNNREIYRHTHSTGRSVSDISDKNVRSTFRARGFKTNRG